MSNELDKKLKNHDYKYQIGDELYVNIKYYSHSNGELFGKKCIIRSRGDGDIKLHNYVTYHYQVAVEGCPDIQEKWYSFDEHELSQTNPN